MKTTLIVLLAMICFDGFGQATRKVIRANQNRTTQNTTTGSTTGTTQAPSSTLDVQPRQTATDRYLNGPSGARTSAPSGSSKNAANSSPFVGGIHAAGNASKTFDTVANNRNNVNNQTTANTTIRGGNDTTFNVNTISQGGVTTNSGAVDRSGQAQFGQTNWGNSRSTVGESQWTIPPPITASFNKEFPASNSATWSRNNVDTTIYSARYKSGAQWVTTNYNAAGQRLDTRTEYPLIQPPRPVSVYIAKQPVGFQVATIYKLQVQGKPDVYEIHTKTGKTIYVNNDGMEVNY